MHPATSDDYHRLAHQRLPRFLADYIDGGANAEVTLTRNVEDFSAIRIRQRVLRDVSSIDTSTTLAGSTATMPLALAPVGMAGLFSRHGEIAAACAAEHAGIPFTLSTVSIRSLAQVRAAVQHPCWFQLYMLRDRSIVRELLADAAQHGCHTLVLTVDLPLAGMRHRDTRNSMLTTTLSARLDRARQLVQRPAWLWNVGIRGRPHGFGNLADKIASPDNLSAYRAWIDAQFDSSVTWQDIAWLRQQWRGKLILKGILEAEDARQAADLGVDGLMVSNHGGRQLDGVSSTITKLPDIVDAVGDRLEVLLDGGIRNGIDIFKALALGAKGVLIGRPWAWALAGAGEQGLSQLLATFRRELEVAMALAGVNRIEQIGKDQLETG